MPELSETILQLLQEQYTLERTNAAAYDSLACGLRAAAWDGAGEWMEHAANDERDHAFMVRDYILDRNKLPIVEGLDPAGMVAGADQVVYFEAALAREETTTRSLIDLHMAAWNEADLQTATFLLPMVNEQTRSVREIQDIIKVINSDADPLVIDQMLAEKVGG